MSNRRVHEICFASTAIRARELIAYQGHNTIECHHAAAPENVEFENLIPQNGALDDVEAFCQDHLGGGKQRQEAHRVEATPQVRIRRPQSRHLAASVLAPAASGVWPVGWRHWWIGGAISVAIMTIFFNTLRVFCSEREKKVMSASIELTEDEARALQASGLGKEELRVVISYCVPIFWVYKHFKIGAEVRNGSAFFLNTGTASFGVTANHVIVGWENHRKKCGPTALRLGCNGLTYEIDWEDRVIDRHEGIDIATFRISHSEVSKLGKWVLTGSQRDWPPKPPSIDRGVFYSGYPGGETMVDLPKQISFGALAGQGVATSVNQFDISTQFEREHMVSEFGKGIPPEDFEFGGISGGPMLTVVEAGIRTWRLAGVITQGPNSSGDDGSSISGFEVIKARRADFILPDGRLDKDLWNSFRP